MDKWWWSLALAKYTLAIFSVDAFPANNYLTADNIELREDGTFELREDGTYEIRE